MRSCSKKARSYIKLYLVIESLDLDKEDGNSTIDKHSIFGRNCKNVSEVEKERQESQKCD